MTPTDQTLAERIELLLNMDWCGFSVSPNEGILELLLIIKQQRDALTTFHWDDLAYAYNGDEDLINKAITASEPLKEILE